MIRGRHRGLPVAIDRAVLLPSEFSEFREDDLASPKHNSPTPNGHVPEASDTFELRQRNILRDDAIVEERKREEKEDI